VYVALLVVEERAAKKFFIIKRLDSDEQVSCNSKYNILTLLPFLATKISCSLTVEKYIP
jgi:hypothetical protein